MHTNINIISSINIIIFRVYRTVTEYNVITLTNTDIVDTAHDEI